VVEEEGVEVVAEVGLVAEEVEVGIAMVEGAVTGDMGEGVAEAETMIEDMIETGVEIGTGTEMGGGMGMGEGAPCMGVGVVVETTVQDRTDTFTLSDWNLFRKINESCI
jgi:hypothetical protein